MKIFPILGHLQDQIFLGKPAENLLGNNAYHAFAQPKADNKKFLYRDEREKKTIDEQRVEKGERDRKTTTMTTNEKKRGNEKKIVRVRRQVWSETQDGSFFYVA